MLLLFLLLGLPGSMGVLHGQHLRARTNGFRTRGMLSRLSLRGSEEEAPVMQNKAILPALLALNTCAVIWGSQHALIKDLVESDVAPSTLNAARFCIAAMLSLPFWPGLPWRSTIHPAPVANATETIRGRGDSRLVPRTTALVTWTAGAELGLWSFLGFTTQSIGLQVHSCPNV